MNYPLALNFRKKRDYFKKEVVLRFTAGKEEIREYLQSLDSLNEGISRNAPVAILPIAKLAGKLLYELTQLNLIFSFSVGQRNTFVHFSFLDGVNRLQIIRYQYNPSFNWVYTEVILTFPLQFYQKEHFQSRMVQKPRVSLEDLTNKTPATLLKPLETAHLKEALHKAKSKSKFVREVWLKLLRTSDYVVLRELVAYKKSVNAALARKQATVSVQLSANNIFFSRFLRLYGYIAGCSFQEPGKLVLHFAHFAGDPLLVSLRFGYTGTQMLAVAYLRAPARLSPISRRQAETSEYTAYSSLLK